MRSKKGGLRDITTQETGVHAIALDFKTKESFRQALEIIFERGITHVLVGETTVIVHPGEMTTPLKALRPERTPVLSAADPDLSPQELTELRREHLGFTSDA